MTLVDDLHAFAAKEGLPEPRWPRKDKLTYLNSEIVIEDALSGLLAVKARGIRMPVVPESDPTWAENWIAYLHAARVLKSSDAGLSAQRIASTVVKKLDELNIWKWLACGPPADDPAVHRNSTNQGQEGGPEDVLAASALPPSSAIDHDGPSDQQEPNMPASVDGADVSAPPAEQRAGRQSRRMGETGPSKPDQLGRIPEDRSMRSQSPVSSMPPIPQTGRQKKQGLSLSTSDIVTTPAHKRAAASQISRRKKKTAGAKTASKPAAFKKCPTCAKIQPGARQKKCECGHNFQAAKDAQKEQKKTKSAEDKWPALKVFNQACNAAEAACLHNAAVQLVVYGAVPRAADKKQAGLQAQVRGFGDLGKETARKAGKTMILSAQMGATHVLTKEKTKTVEKADPEPSTVVGAVTYKSVDDFLDKNKLSAIKDQMPPGMDLDLLKYINHEQMKEWNIPDIYWGKITSCAKRIATADEPL